MSRHYFLYVFDYAGNYYWPLKIYSSRSYALKVAREHRWKKIKLAALNRFNSFYHDKEEEFVFDIENNDYVGVE